MTTLDINSFRKYSFNVSLNEVIDQVHQQLCQLLNNNQIHFSKRKKLLLQLERKNNQVRRLIDQSDNGNQQKLKDNFDLIRRIKKKIIQEDRQQEQRRRDEHEQNNPWSPGYMTALFGIILAGLISIATIVIMMLDKSNEKLF